MRVALTISVFLAPFLLLFVLAGATPLATQRECTPQEIHSYEDWRQQRLPPKCSVQKTFNVCDDDCHAAYEVIVPKAPNCTQPFEGIDTAAKIALRVCEIWRPVSTNGYMPTIATGLANCTNKQLDDWREQRKLTLFDECSSNATRAEGCTDACVYVLESGITNASVCADKSGYGLGEASKSGLINCLRVRGDRLVDNRVLNTVVNGDGSTTTYVASTAPVSTTKPPAPSAVSGSARSLMSTLAAVCTMLLSLAMA